jgi:hypothetical protein
MEFYAWLEIAIAMGLACLPVMRHWEMRVAQMGQPEYALVWIKSEHFHTTQLQLQHKGRTTNYDYGDIGRKHVGRNFTSGGSDVRGRGGRTIHPHRRRRTRDDEETPRPQDDRRGSGGRHRRDHLSRYRGPDTRKIRSHQSSRERCNFPDCACYSAGRCAYTGRRQESITRILD